MTINGKIIKNIIVGIILSFLGLCFIYGCKPDSRNSELHATLYKYIGQKLKLPPESVCHFLDKEYGFTTLDADYLIVSYVKSQGCTPCHLHLPYWKGLNSIMDTLSNSLVESVLIIEPDTIDKVIDFIRTANYDYHVVIDSIGKFSNLNILPKQSFLQTFLVDRYGKILGLGNPVEEEAVAKYYLSVITGNKEPAYSTPLRLEKNKVDIGIVPHGYKNEFTFVIENTSTDTVTIDKIINACECIKTQAENIPPKGSATVKISFDASLTDGAFHQPIIVRYKEIKSPLIFHIYGYVYDLYDG